MFGSIFRGRRWGVVWLLFLAGVVNYADRSALSIAAPLIEKELGFDAAQMGLIFSSFFFGYAIFNFLGGYASDKFGAKLILIVAMAAWSIFCGMTALAVGFTSLIVVRILFGIGEGPFNATANKMVNNWFPRKEAAGAVGLLSAGTPLGGFLAGPLIGTLCVTVGWRLAFVVIAGIGLLWVALWAIFVAEKPEKDKKISAEELDYILSEQAKSANTATGQQKQPLLRYLTMPVILATALAFFSYNYILYFFLTWFPSYLTMAHGLNIKSMSMVNMIPWAVGFVGLASGGFISDAIFKATGRGALARKIVLVGGLGGAAVCVIIAGNVVSIYAAVALMSAAIFFLYLTGAIYWAIIQDIVPAQNVGGVGGFVHFLANLSGVIGPAVTGYLVLYTGNFSSAFVLAGVIAIAGATGILIFLKETAVAAK